MSNRTNIAQFMPQGIKGPKLLLQQAAMEKWNAIKPKANAGSRSQIEGYLREDGPPPVVHVRAAPGGGAGREAGGGAGRGAGRRGGGGGHIQSPAPCSRARMNDVNPAPECGTRCVISVRGVLFHFPCICLSVPLSPCPSISLSLSLYPWTAKSPPPPLRRRPAKPQLEPPDGVLP
jgi:hypothetical protein